MPPDSNELNPAELSPAPSWLNVGSQQLTIFSRVVAALFGGYAFTWSFTALGMTLLVVLGSDFHEAEMSMMLVAFLVFLALFLWAFAAASVVRVWAILGGGAALMAALAWALQHALLS